MSQVLQEAIRELSATFEQFKSANDTRLEEVRKSITDTADGLITDKVERINAALTEQQEKVEQLQKSMNNGLEDLEGKIAINGGGTATTSTNNTVAAFNELADTKFTPEEFKAYKQDLDNYMRKGRISNAMKVSEDPAGGYWVDPAETGAMVRLIYESSPVRQLASVVTIGSDALEGPYDLNELSTGWVGEMSSRTETTTPDVGSWRIPVHEMYAMPKVTQKLLDDSSVDIESFLRQKVADKMARTEATAFVSGDGAGKPRGFLDYTLTTSDITATGYGSNLQKVITGSNGAFGSSDNLVDLIYALKPQYRTGSVFFMNRSTEAAIRKLKDGQSNYLWQPNFQSLTASSLLGFPIVTGEDMPDIAASSKSVVFGNFARGYQIVERQGIRLLRDNLTSKPFTLLYFTRRIGGDVIDYDALKVLEFTA